MKRLPRLLLIFAISILVSGMALMLVSAQSSPPEDSASALNADMVALQQQPGTLTVEGGLTIVHRDPAPDSGLDYVAFARVEVSPTEYYILDIPIGQVWEYQRQQVRVVGRPVLTPASDIGESILAVDMILPLEDARQFLDPSAGNYNYINLLCQFSDSGTPDREPAYFDELFSTTYPGIGHHWATVSYGNVTLNGTGTVSEWRTLGSPSTDYTGSTSSQTQLLEDCAALFDDVVDFSQYEGINLMLDQSYVGFAQGTPGRTLTLDGETRFWRVSWNPPFSYRDQFFISHEIGHTVQLPHSASEYRSASRWPYDQFWDVMSGGGEDFSNPLPDPNGVIGLLGPGTAAYYAYRVGWIEEDRAVFVNEGEQRTVTLERLIDPVSDENKLVALVPIGGSTTDLYAVEAHFQNSYGEAVPNTAVVIYRVDLDRNEDAPARVVDGDGDGDANDAGAQWLPGETFTDSANNIAITVDSQGTSSFTVTIANGDDPVEVTEAPEITETAEITETVEVTETATPEVTETATPEVTATTTPEVTATTTPEVTATTTPEVTVTVPPTQLELLSPSGLITSSTGNPTYVWSDIGASSYLFFLSRANFEIMPLGNPFSIDIRDKYVYEQVFASNACNGVTCSFEPTEVSTLGWLFNDDYEVWLCASGCNLGLNWFGPFEFTLNVPEPTAPVALTSTTSNITFDFQGNAANTGWMQVYMAPTDDITNDVIFQWFRRDQICGDYSTTVCNWALPITLTSGREYTLYVQPWTPGGLSTAPGNILGWLGPIIIRP